MFEHSPAASLPDQGLIFATGPSPDIIVPPRSYCIVPIVTALVDYAIKPHVDIYIYIYIYIDIDIDIDIIHRRLLAPSGSKVEKSLPVRFDRYSNTLVIATKSGKPWAIKARGILPWSAICSSG